MSRRGSKGLSKIEVRVPPLPEDFDVHGEYGSRGDFARLSVPVPPELLDHLKAALLQLQIAGESTNLSRWLREAIVEKLRRDQRPPK